MSREKLLHVVVRWGATVLVAKEVAPETRALRSALSAQTPELAARLSVANGRVVVDEVLELGEAREGVVGDFVVEATSAVDERGVRPKKRPNGLVIGGALISVIAHGMFVASVVLFRPALEATSADAPRSIRAELEAMNAAIEPTSIAPPPPNDDGPPGSFGGEPGSMSARKEGAMGSRTAQKRHSQYGISGTPKPRSAEGGVPGIDDVRSFGMIGLLASRATLDDDARTGGWGTNFGGPDARFAHGEMWGAEIDDAFGDGGLGLSGTGEGGGGHGHGVGLVPDDLDVFGHGEGLGMGGADEALSLFGIGTIGGGGRYRNGDGSCDGCVARLSGSHRSKAPRLSQDRTQVSGRLPPEVIQRIVRQNFGRFRLCYEQALAPQPNLQGRVAVRFVIDRDGAVASASVSDSTLSSSASSCVARAFSALSFPAPDGGVVTVTYPINFSPE